MAKHSGPFGPGFDWKTRRTEIRKVSPAEATELLSHRNNSNRPLVPGRVEVIAAAMRAGAFRFNGDTIRVDWNGELLDGQHRLWAVSMGEQSVEMLFIFGLDPEVFDTIDTGAGRTAGDTIAKLGVTRQRPAMASACQWLVRWERDDFARNDQLRRVSNGEIKAFLRAHPDVPAAVERCSPLRSVMPVGLLSALVWRVAQRDPDLADRVISKLAEPAGLPTNDPMFVLRDQTLHTRYRGKQKPVALLAAAIKAVNAEKDGRRVKALSWRRHGIGAEAFPKLAL